MGGDIVQVLRREKRGKLKRIRKKKTPKEEQNFEQRTVSGRVRCQKLKNLFGLYRFDTENFVKGNLVVLLLQEAKPKP